ncbi:MAG: ornithine carbamoyltransferase [Azospirillum sp.]|nr:ornithine carbamoyltransferase [Azospirillum sp.]MCA3266424.1 ornithine carbamoyltransferase [Azospirillum sp.]MCZ8123657.1 ornithine carbamoyltransferase [Magnetospirillum sp.]
MPKTPKHFLDLDALETGALRAILDLGAKYKAQRGLGAGDKPLAGKTLAMIFEKPSTRTRVSFEVGIRQLGGEAVILTHHDTQLGRGETIADTARVLSRYCDAIMLRTNKSAHLDEMVRHASVPVINGLTERSHPCQVMADVMTFEERKGSIAGKVVAWAGDGNNVAASWIHAAQRFAFELRLACPEPLRPSDDVLAWARREGARIQLLTDPEAAVRGADAVVTDTWVSMDQEGNARERENREKRHNMLVPYRVDERLMGMAKADAMFLHCLPAHRGEEVTEGVIDGPQSAVWDEAENRLHVQKGILAWCMA